MSQAAGHKLQASSYRKVFIETCDMRLNFSPNSYSEALRGKSLTASPAEGALSPNSYSEALRGKSLTASPAEGALSPNN
jgi:hypothetical protein